MSTDKSWIKATLIVKSETDPVSMTLLLEHFMRWVLIENDVYNLTEATKFSGIEIRVPMSKLEADKETLSMIIQLLLEEWNEIFHYEPVFEQLHYVTFAKGEKTGDGFLAIYETT